MKTRDYIVELFEEYQKETGNSEAAAVLTLAHIVNSIGYTIKVENGEIDER